MSFSSHSSRTGSQPGPPLGECGGPSAKKAPVFKEPWGADWQHPAATSWGKMGKPETEFELLQLLGWWVHPAAAVLTRKTFRPVFLHKFNPRTSCEGKGVDGEVLEANTVAEGVTRVYTKLSLVGSLIFFRLSLPLFGLSNTHVPQRPPSLTDDPKSPTPALSAMQACCSRRLLIGHVTPLKCQRWAPPPSFQQLAALSFSKRFPTCNWVMTFREIGEMKWETWGRNC